MRKKYLSALLFGALLVTSAGTFTSCKDYDDDINNLQEQITANADAIKKLQEMIGDGKFVTNIVAENNGLKITWNDEQTTVIENVINGEAQQGDVVSIDPETGEIKINDKGTGFFASKSEDNGVKLPYVNEEGVLVLVDAEGKEVVTGIRVAPVTAVVNPDGSAVLTIIAADGTTQVVNVPSANSLVTSILLAGNETTYEFDFPLAYASNDDHKMINVNKTAWNKKAVVSPINYDINKEAYSGSRGCYVDVVVSPSTIDVKDLTFKLQNSKGKTVWADGVVCDAPTLQSRSNGVYRIYFAFADGITKDDLNGDNKILSEDDALAVVCGKASTDYKISIKDGKFDGITSSLSNPSVTVNNTIDNYLLTAVGYVKLGDKYSIYETIFNQDPSKAGANKNVGFFSAFEGVTDAKLEIDSERESLYGVKIEDNTFTITDEKAYGQVIPFTLKYTDYTTTEGSNIKEVEINVIVQSKPIASTVTLSTSHVLSTENDKKYAYIPLENLVNSLTTEQKIVWNETTDVTLDYYSIVNNVSAGALKLVSSKEYSGNKLTLSEGSQIKDFSLVKSDKTSTNSLKEAAFIKFEVVPNDINVTADVYSSLVEFNLGYGKAKVQANIELTLTNPATKFTRIPLYFDGDNLTAYGNVSGNNLEFNVTSAYNDGAIAPSFTVVNKEDKDGWTVINSNKTIQIPLDKLYTTTQKFEVSYLMFDDAEHNKVTETVYVTGQSPIKDGEVTVSKTELSLATGSDTFTSKDIKGVDVFNKEYVLFATANAETATTNASVTGTTDDRIESITLEVTDANKGAFEINEIYSWVDSGKLYQAIVDETGNIIGYISKNTGLTNVNISTVTTAQLTGFSVKLKESTGVANGAKVPFKLTITDEWGQKVEKEISLTVEK